MIYTYSKAHDGDRKLSANFKVREFACKDGTNLIYVDEDLISLCETIRQTLGRPVNVNSGYRTPWHNQKIGGSDSSQHVFGRAADLTCPGVHPAVIAYIADQLLNYDAGGIELITTNGGKGGYCHVDVRSKRWRAIGFAEGSYTTMTGWMFPALRKGAKSPTVRVMQELIAWHGIQCDADGSFGEKTKKALLTYQRENDLAVDGVCGPATWAKLMEV